jgi:hypothetical protein
MNEQAPARREPWGLAALATFLYWCEELLALLSGPLLVFGLGVGLTDLFTDHALTRDVQGLIVVWAMSLAVGTDVQLIGMFAKARQALRERNYWQMVGALIIGAILGYIGWVSAQIYSVEQAQHITTGAALAQLGFDPTAWLVQRSFVAVGLVMLSGWTRYHPPSKASQLDSASDRAAVHQAELDEAQHKARLRAIQVGGIRTAVRAGLGRDDRPPTGPGSPATAPTPSKGRAAAASGGERPAVLTLEPPPDWRRTGNRRARTYSAERRVFALLEREPDLSAMAIAKRLKISESTASKYARVWREKQRQAQQAAQ